MLVANVATSVSPPLRRVVDTDVGTQSQITHSEQNWRDKWLRLIDDPLIEWGYNSSQVDDDETPMPSAATVSLAIRVAQKFHDQSDPAPTRIVLDAHGGIVFEHEAGSMFESIRISADNSVEHCLFKNFRMVKRDLWPVEIFDSE